MKPNIIFVMDDQHRRLWQDKSGSHAVIMQTMAAALVAKVGAAPVGPRSRRDWATISSVCSVPL